MRKRKNVEGNEMVTIASKVSRADKAKIQTIAKAFGMTFYELLQSLLLGMLRYFDIGRHSTYDHNCMMDALVLAMNSVKDSYSPLKKIGRNNRKIKGAILFIEETKKRRPQLLSVCINDDGEMTETFNFDQMTRDFLSCIDPESIERLEYHKKELGYFSITHTLHEIIMQHTNSKDEMQTDIEDMFKDVRTYSGQAVNEDIHYQQAYRTNVDEYTTITPKQKFRADI